MVSKNYALISILSKKYKILKNDLKERTESFCDKIFKAAAILDKKLKILIFFVFIAFSFSSLILSVFSNNV